MQAIANKRRTLKGRVTRLENALAPHDENNLLTMSELVVSEQRVEELWGVTIHLLEEAGGAAVDDAEFQAEETEFAAIEKRIHDLQKKMTELRFALEPRRPAAPTAPPTAVGTGAGATVNEVRLPRLELPIFSGRRQDWLSFHDLFQAAVHRNTSLSGAQKLQYLKASVQGEAAALIQLYKISDDNFDEAWKALEKRYQDRRELLNASFDRLLAIPTLHMENPAALQKLGDQVRECIHAVDILTIPRETAYELQLIHLVAKKLDSESRLQWERQLKKDELPTLIDFCDFIDQQARVTEAAKSSGKGKTENRKPGASVHHGSQSSSCPVCQKGHHIYQCKKFKDMTTDEKWEIARDHRLCFKCLIVGHTVPECRASRCKHCSRPHHSLLHRFDNDRMLAGEQQQGGQPQDGAVSANFATSRRHTQGLLSTALLRVRDSRGYYQFCRALLDCGAETSFVTSKCATRLGLRRRKIDVPLSGIAESQAGVVKEMVEMAFISCYKDDPIFQVDGFVVKTITKDLPASPLPRAEWNHIEGLELADPCFYEPGKIDILLGADIYYDLMLPGKKTGPPGTPTALMTELGWILGGRLDATKPATVSAHFVRCVNGIEQPRCGEREKYVIPQRRRSFGGQRATARLKSLRHSQHYGKTRTG